MESGIGLFHQAGIYAIVHVLSGTRYVGQTRDIRLRWEQHLEQLRAGNHHNIRLQKAWNGDGAAAFEFRVVEVAPTGLAPRVLQGWLARQEDLHITTFKSHGLAFNIVDAELVAPAPISQVSINPNSEITEELNALAPEIKASEARQRQAEHALRSRQQSAEQLRRDAAPRLFGLLGLFSYREVERQSSAVAALRAEEAAIAQLQAAADAARGDTSALVTRRRELYASYSGNQRRSVARRNRRSMF